MLVEQPNEKKMLPKGFLTRNGMPTQNALMMYFVYLSNSPQGWNHEKSICRSSLEKVRQYFGTDYGFECMIRWGVIYGCSNSETSDGRHFALSKAWHDAKGMMGKGYMHSTIKIQ
jgi:hypothetical protein